MFHLVTQAGITIALLGVVLVPVQPASIRSNRSNRLRRGIPSKPLLVGYWGQNGAGRTFGPANYERPLKWFCENSKYDIINLAFLVTLFDSRNLDSLPGLNFAYHCGGGVSPQHPFLLRCPAIEEGIKSCQKNNKQVLLSVGGATGNAVLGSQEKAEELANTLWQLFLGGNDTDMRNLRPFGTAILDGIDLNIEGGSHQYFPDLIRELRRLMASDSSKTYLVTSAPQCPHPDRYLGPQTPGTALEDTGELTDYVFIQFYNNPCWTGAGQQFESSLDSWLSFSKRKNVGVMIGLPAHPGASGHRQYHRTVSDMENLYEQIRSKAGVSGIMLWDCSWDQNNLVDGKMYSEHIRKILDARPTQPPPPDTTTTQPPPPDTTTTQPPPPDTTTTQSPPPDTTTTQPPPPDTTTTQSPPPDPTTTQSPPPDPTTTQSPPPDTTTTQPPPPDTTTTQPPPPDTTTTQPPPPDTTTTQSPPPDTTTTQPPPPDTTTTQPLPPDTTTTQPPPPDTTTTQPPPPDTTTTQPPPPDTTTTQPPPPDTTTTQPPSPGTTTSPTTTTVVSCQGKSWGIYRHPSDCTKFIMCAPNGILIQSCPAGLKFNPQILVCDWPRNVTC